MIERFILFQGVILFFFLAGSGAKRKYCDTSRLSRRIISANLIFIEPIIAFWSVWGLTLSKDLMILPLAGILLVFMGMGLGMLFNGIFKLRGKRKATFLISSGLANHGFTMGGFLCYLLLGEKGLALSIIFISYFMPLVFIFVFPYARASGQGKKEDSIQSNMKRLKPFFFGLQNMPLYALLLAIVLQLAGFTRPAYEFPLDLLLLASVALYYFSLGSNFRFVHFKGAFKENSALAVIKFLFVPLVAFIVLQGVPLATTTKQVIMLEAFMPVAVYSVVSSLLFDLDSDLASGVFVLNTLLFLVVVLPLIVFAFSTVVAF